MNKLREQIAEAIRFAPPCESQGEYEDILTDAILALLQPRILSKDEAAEHIKFHEGIDCFEADCEPCSKSRAFLAKLQAIQEEDSE